MASKTKLQIVVETKLGSSEKNLKKVEKGVDRVGTKAKKANKQVGFFKKGLNDLGKKLKDNIGTLTAVVAGVVALGVAYFNLTEQVRKNKKQVEDLTGETGLALDNLTVKVQTISDVFGDEFNEVIRAGNTLSKEFGITQVEALDLIEKGYIKGSNASGELLDMIKEYPTFMKSVKVSAEEMFVIMNKQVKDGVFGDKGIDAIKEADLKLKEFSKTTKQALDAVGLNSEELQKQIESGALSRFQVIQKVSEKMQELGEDSAKTSALVRDVFGGPGEDAGFKFLSTLNEIDKAQEKYNGELTESQQLQAESLIATEKINKALLGLADNKAVVNAWNGVKLIFADGLELLNKMLDFPSEFDKNIKQIQDLGIDTSSLEAINKLQQEIEKQIIRRAEIQTKINFLKNLELSVSKEEAEIGEASTIRQRNSLGLFKNRLFNVLTIKNLEDEIDKQLNARKDTLIAISLIDINRTTLKGKEIELAREERASLVELSKGQQGRLEMLVRTLSERKELIEINKNLITQEKDLEIKSKEIENNTRTTVGLWDEAVNHLKEVQAELDNVNNKTKEIDPIELIAGGDDAKQIIIDRTALTLESINELNEEFRLEQQHKAELDFENGLIFEEDFLQMKIDFNNAELDAFESMLLNKKITQKDFDKKRRSSELTNAKLSNDLIIANGKQEKKIVSDVQATRFASMIAQVDFTKNIGSQLVKLALREAVAKLIPSIIAGVPFPLNIALAGTAPALVDGLFSALPAFAHGGIVSGNSLTGDNVLARLNSQEEVLTRDDPRHILNQSFTGNDDTSKAINRLADGLEAVTDELALRETNIVIENEISFDAEDLLEVTEQGQRDQDRRSI